MGGVVLLFEAFYLDVSSPAITLAVHLLMWKLVVMVVVVVVVVDWAYRAEVVAVPTGGFFALEAAGSAGSDGASDGGRGHGREGSGEGEGGAGRGLGEHGEGGVGARGGRVSGDGGEEGFGNGMELCGCVERGHC